MENWTLHDLRRTLATNLGRRQVLPHVIEHILNHKAASLTDIGEIYNLYTYVKQKREALQMWSNHIEWLIKQAGLVLALVAELRLLRTQDLAHHLARDLQLTADRFDRLPLDQRQPTYLCNRLQNQHPKHKRLRSNRRHLDDPIVKGSRLDENHPLNRVLIHEKSMHYLPKLREIATDRFEGAFGGLVSEVVA